MPMSATQSSKCNVWRFFSQIMQRVFRSSLASL